MLHMYHMTEHSSTDNVGSLSRNILYLRTVDFVPFEGIKSALVIDAQAKGHESQRQARP